MPVEPDFTLNLGNRITPEADALRIEAQHCAATGMPFNIMNRLYMVVSNEVNYRGNLIIGLAAR